MHPAFSHDLGSDVLLSPLCEEDTIHLLTEHMGGDEFAPWKMTPTGDPGMYYAD